MVGRKSGKFNDLGGQTDQKDTFRYLLHDRQYKMIILLLRKFVVKENIFKLLRFISFASYMACLVTFQCDLIIVLKRY